MIRNPGGLAKCPPDALQLIRPRCVLILFLWSVLSYAYPQLAAAAAKLFQSCPTLCDPIDGSPPGSAVPRIFQARTLEWVAISFSNA